VLLSGTWTPQALATLYHENRNSEDGSAWVEPYSKNQTMPVIEAARENKV